MKLTYWVAEDESHLGSQCYNIRAKTKKEAQALVVASGKPNEFGQVHKVVVEYADAFDLMYLAMSEAHIYEGE